MSIEPEPELRGFAADAVVTAASSDAVVAAKKQASLMGVTPAQLRSLQTASNCCPFLPVCFLL